jgi:hypothetical protein
MARRYSISCFSVVEPHPEHVGGRELIHPLVELPEDGVEVEGRGDLSADLAQQLDVLLALAFRAGQALRGLGAQPGFGELRPLPFLGHQPPPLDPIDAHDTQGQEGQVAAVGPPGSVPGRKDGEHGGLVAQPLPTPRARSIVTKPRLVYRARRRGSRPAARSPDRRVGTGVRDRLVDATAPRTRSERGQASSGWALGHSFASEDQAFGVTVTEDQGRKAVGADDDARAVTSGRPASPSRGAVGLG